MPYAYVIFDKKHPSAVETIKAFLQKNNIHSIGRYGAWEYSFMEKSILDGKKTAEMIQNNE
jgi:protoporphyrinogen oxidase